MTSLALERSAPPSELFPESGEFAIGFRGFVHGVSLVDLFQIFHYSRRSLIVAIDSDSEVHFEEGEIVHAKKGRSSGEAAFRAILELRSGTLKTSTCRPGEHTIDRSFQSLLLDCLREVDESNRDEILPSSVPPVPFLSANSPSKRSSLLPAGSIFPSGFPGRSLLLTAAEQLLARVDHARSVAIVDLESGRPVVSVGQIDADRAGSVVRTSFRATAMVRLEDVLEGRAPSSSESPVLDEIRLFGPYGLCMGKRLVRKSMAVVLWAGTEASLGLAWAELRQAVSMVERIMI